jgi:thiol-disulfide isomerase/thioredoxin
LLEVYTRTGCARCAQAEPFLANLARERPDIRIVTYDVSQDADALARLRELAARRGIQAAAVPAFVCQDKVLIGFDGAATMAQIERMLAGATPSFDPSNTCTADPSACEPERAGPSEALEVPLFGRISVEKLGLPLFTIVVGLIDGVNPCATWVLLFLLAMLVNLKSRPRMALIAGTFVAVSGIVYFAFMAAWLTFFMVVGISQLVRIVLAVVALAIGALNLKDAVAFGHGPSLSIPESAKPGLYARMRGILHAENLSGALAGVIALAFLVNLVELLCTAGLPALYTAILTSRGLPLWQHYAYLALYIAGYIFDDSIMVTIGVVTLSKRKLQESGGRVLKLVSAVVMLALGTLLLAKPEWLGF